MKKRPACIFMAYPLVKFGADSFTIKGDTERDRQTDRQTQGDSNSSTGLRPSRAKNQFISVFAHNEYSKILYYLVFI